MPRSFLWTPEPRQSTAAAPLFPRDPFLLGREHSHSLSSRLNCFAGLVAMENSAAVSYLEKLLGKTLRIQITDGRMFIGQMKCTDKVCCA